MSVVLGSNKHMHFNQFLGRIMQDTNPLAKEYKQHASGAGRGWMQLEYAGEGDDISADETRGPPGEGPSSACVR